MNESAAAAQAQLAPQVELTAYRIDLDEVFFGKTPAGAQYPKLVPAAADRFWMDVGTKGWANRRLPLRIANQAGWFVLNDCDIDIVWTGNAGLDSVQITGRNGGPTGIAQSVFGHGVVTWVIPYLFRTSPGCGLLARGPANGVKDAIVPLDGLVETDWLPYTFTMNWKFTRPGQRVRFDRDEPICMIQPVRFADLESCQPRMVPLESDAGLHEQFRMWHEQRLRTSREAQQNPARAKELMEGKYIRGEDAHGNRQASHRNKLQLAPFLGDAPSRRIAAAQPPQRHTLGDRIRRWWKTF
jgi:hypothetical protein